MPATIEDILRGKPDVITTTMDASIKGVLGEMIKHDYSQLPVVDSQNKPIGMITNDSILRTLHRFNSSIGNLKVRDAMVRVPASYRTDDDIFDLLDGLQQSDVALVVDEHRQLLAIITTYDTTAYLRQRAQDIMMVRDIEEMIKSYINAAFTSPTGEIDEEKRQEAVNTVTFTPGVRKEKFQQALTAYLSQAGITNSTINPDILESTFRRYIYTAPVVKTFDKLTLNGYIDILTSQSRWRKYTNVFSLERATIIALLQSVRDTRNALAHFRDNISDQQREELRFCKEWLARHEEAVNRTFGLAEGAALAPQPEDEPEEQAASTRQEGTSTPSDHAASGGSPSTADADPTVAESSGGASGRYAPLIGHLVSQPQSMDKLTMTFGEIDQILGEPGLPPSARAYRAWWGNDTTSHGHAQQWLGAGWHVATVVMAEERVTFARSSSHERGYLAFFTTLRAELEQAAPGAFRIATPTMRHYLTLDTAQVEGRTVAQIYATFARMKRFRIELYIEADTKERSKELFDLLAERRKQIEAELGEQLDWERLDAYNPARVASYTPGSIAAEEATLAQLRAWAVATATKIAPVLRRHLAEVGAEAEKR
ncbi:DUF4268 domain-containing protein [Chloroflexia bacterium SDU3-3]|nr:DUF4268 domain-containing protein [Chloroflexia bacterium SDU3-3]